MSKYKTYNAGNHGNFKSEDLNNTTMMRIIYDNYPCGILTVGRTSTNL